MSARRCAQLPSAREVLWEPPRGVGAVPPRRAQQSSSSSSRPAGVKRTCLPLRSCWCLPRRAAWETWGRRSSRRQPQGSPAASEPRQGSRGSNPPHAHSRSNWNGAGAKGRVAQQWGGGRRATSIWSLPPSHSPANSMKPRFRQLPCNSAALSRRQQGQEQPLGRGRSQGGQRTSCRACPPSNHACLKTHWPP